MNKLYYGDCLTIMQDMPMGSVDLVYLDPPFNSNQEYSAIYEDETGRPLPDQIEAFNDLWTLDEERERSIRHMPILMRDAGVDDDIAEFWRFWVNALRKANPKLLAYLSYMTERLLPLRSIVKPTGSIYLHCDPTASHYIKVMMDAIFGHDNFRNEVIWKRTESHGRAKKWGPIHDTLLFYTRSKHYTWNRVYQPYNESYIKSHYNQNDSHGQYRTVTLDGPGVRGGSSGLPWRGVDPSEKGRHWELPPDRALPGWFRHPEGYSDMTVQERLDVLDGAGLIYWPPRGKLPAYKRYLSVAQGTQVQDIITDIDAVNSQSKERLGYATQKPVALMERIISASSNEGDVVLDPFCGCASTIEAAQNLKRRWIGIDIAIHAIKRVAKVRLEDKLGLEEGIDFEIRGIPKSFEGAQDLWTYDKHHFQKWAIEQVDGFVTTKKTGDGGIDGRLYFELPGAQSLRSMLLEVKGGKNVGISVVRDLRGTLEREGAELAGLIVMDDLGPRKTANFHSEMAQAGDLEVSGVLYPRMQMLTIPEILEGKRFATPSVAKGKIQTRQPQLPFG
ncbi:DNA methyltransferase [Vannielia litorea]|uniref:DNA methyltransferase n=1 Tax=Vannielia litorea TaxID=1217970 RepID=UPI001BD0E760|nr:DNA methyltransferase [Vannielia litorea]MBS8226797.1 site-specific DNA-methyltransferase [Vannielia litorea]